jgi:hypothetical protein
MDDSIKGGTYNALRFERLKFLSDLVSSVYVAQKEACKENDGGAEDLCSSWGAVASRSKKPHGLSCWRAGL